MLELFYCLIPQSYDLLKCKDYRIANLIMIQLPDFLIAFSNRTNMTSNQTESDNNASQLHTAEYGHLSYIAGCIRKIEKKRTILTRSSNSIGYCMHAMKSTNTAQEFISAQSRGGLVPPTAVF